MKLHVMIEDANRLDDLLDDLDADIATLAAFMKRVPANGVKPTSEHIKRLWLAHEKLGDVYEAVEKAKRA
jgi:hypothetical protein